MNEKSFSQLLLDPRGDFILVAGPDEPGAPSVFLDAGDLVCARLGYALEELLALSPAQIFDRPGLERLEKTGPRDITRFETALRSRSGKMVPVIIRSRLWRGWERPVVVAVVGENGGREVPGNVGDDNYSLLRAVMEEITEAAAVIDIRGAIRFSNRQAARDFGRRGREPAAGGNIRDYWPPDQANSLIDDIKGVIESNQPREREVEIRFHGRERRTLRRLVPARRGPGKTPAVIYISRDITAQREAESALRRKSEEQGLLLEALETKVCFFIDEETQGVVNSSYLRFLGAPREKVEFKKLSEFLPPDAAESCRRINREVFEAGTAIQAAEWFHFPGEEPRLLSITRTPKLDGAGRVEFMVCTGRDITARRWMEERGIKAGENNRMAADSIPGWDYWIGPAGDFLFVSPSCLDITGYAPHEFMADPGLMDSLIHPEDRDSFQAFKNAAACGPARDTKTNEFEFRLVRRDGAARWLSQFRAEVVDWRGQLLGTRVDNRDVTERRALEAQLMHAQKMESVGRLAGGVAHDFNNMLQAILGFTQLCLAEPNVSAPILEKLGQIKLAAERSANLTRQLLTFARKQSARPVVLHLNDVVSSLKGILTRLVREDITLHWEPGEGLWPVEIDPAQIDQVLANLVVNARDAIQGVGEVFIQTSNVSLSRWEPASPVLIPPGEYVQLEVRDTGLGVDRETLSRIFEPFFTTKDEGRGVGLGLSIVYGIVKQNNGFITASGEVGRGMTFRIFLPRAMDMAEEPEGARAIESLLPGGNETVLLVEDEAQILDLAGIILTQLGYKVLTARSPEGALAAAADYGEKIDLLLTDVILPVMNGRELNDRLNRVRPGLKCLFMSGHASSLLVRREILEQGLDYIQKPFTVQELAGKVREALDHAPARRA
ncbi:MAG: PAS domain S-box protein [Pseudomonadota bacterium]